MEGPDDEAVALLEEIYIPQEHVVESLLTGDGGIGSSPEAQPGTCRDGGVGRRAQRQ